MDATAGGLILRSKRQVASESLKIELTFQTTVLEGVLLFYMGVCNLTLFSYFTLGHLTRWPP